MQHRAVDRRRLVVAAWLLAFFFVVSSPVGLGGVLVPGEIADAANQPEPLKRAKQRAPQRYQFARSIQATIASTPDRRSFYIYWPSQRRGGKVIVTLHGYFKSAIDDLAYWYGHAAPRGYSVLALQWRLGDTAADSYTPGEIYGQVTRILRAHGVQPGDAVLHGYSSSAGRVYGIAAMDRRAADYFSLFIANSGAAVRGYPLWTNVFGGGWGRRSLGGTNWVLYCGGRDTAYHSRCSAMRRTRRLLNARGGRVYSLIVDPDAKHGGFLESRQAVGGALGTFSDLSGP